jgi:hypothetical protein
MASGTILSAIHSYTPRLQVPYLVPYTHTHHGFIHTTEDAESNQESIWVELDLVCPATKFAPALGLSVATSIPTGDRDVDGKYGKRHTQIVVTSVQNDGRAAAAGFLPGEKSAVPRSTIYTIAYQGGTIYTIAYQGGTIYTIA